MMNRVAVVAVVITLSATAQAQSIDEARDGVVDDVVTALEKVQDKRTWDAKGLGEEYAVVTALGREFQLRIRSWGSQRDERSLALSVLPWVELVVGSWSKQVEKNGLQSGNRMRLPEVGYVYGRIAATAKSRAARARSTNKKRFWSGVAVAAETTQSVLNSGSKVIRAGMGPTEAVYHTILGIVSDYLKK